MAIDDLSRLCVARAVEDPRCPLGGVKVGRIQGALLLFGHILRIAGLVCLGCVAVLWIAACAKAPHGDSRETKAALSELALGPEFASVQEAMRNGRIDRAIRLMGELRSAHPTLEASSYLLEFQIALRLGHKDRAALLLRRSATLAPSVLLERPAQLQWLRAELKVGACQTRREGVLAVAYLKDRVALRALDSLADPSNTEGTRCRLTHTAAMAAAAIRGKGPVPALQEEPSAPIAVPASQGEHRLPASLGVTR